MAKRHVHKQKPNRVVGWRACPPDARVDDTSSRGAS